MERRPYGDSGERLSVVGFGGILVTDETPAGAERLVGRAIERGINYFDVAPLYGNAEERLGPALKPYRQEVFLACKTLERTREGARRELERSLRRLRTEHLDLYQHHSVLTVEEAEQILGSGGAMEAFLEAREQGLVRYLGFSAHSEEAALALLDGFSFDSILFPFNWVAWHQTGFGPRVMERAMERGAARLGLKALAKRPWRPDEERRWSKAWYAPVDTFDEASLNLRFTLSLPVTAAVSPGHEPFLSWACDVAERLEPLSEEEIGRLRAGIPGFAPLFPLEPEPA